MRHGGAAEGLVGGDIAERGLLEACNLEVPIGIADDAMRCRTGGGRARPRLGRSLLGPGFWIAAAEGAASTTGPTSAAASPNPPELELPPELPPDMLPEPLPDPSSPEPLACGPLSDGPAPGPPLALPQATAKSARTAIVSSLDVFMGRRSTRSR